MTFREFKSNFNNLIGKDTRHDGEVLMDYLAKIWNQEHIRIREGFYEEDIDPKVEEIVPDTLRHLETVWWKRVIDGLDK